MHGCTNSDGDRRIDWGKTSRDYSDWRPDYPLEFYRRLQELGVGLPAQKILDLGTGAGFLACQFARQGADVTGLDISDDQIQEARRLAEVEGLSVTFLVAPAESSGLPSDAFDVATASQSWLYFDKEVATQEVKRLLRRDGVLVTSHFCWLPREDPIAKASEALVLKHNPAWSAADWAGVIPPVPSWAEGHFDVVDMFVFDVRIPFTRESWRGRFRACRGVGASLSPEEVDAFDREHDALLRSSCPDEFTVLHRIDAHILRPQR